MTVPDLAKHLAGLSQVRYMNTYIWHLFFIATDTKTRRFWQILESRLSTYGRLASLGGRLELILSQVQQQKEFSQLRQGPAEPKATYNEEDDDDSDALDDDDDDDEEEDEEDMLNGIEGSDGEYIDEDEGDDEDDL